MKFEHDLNPSFDDSVTIDQNGDIPVVGGRLPVAGLAPEEAAEKIRDYYGIKIREWHPGRPSPQVWVSRF